jgi:CRISPR-associated exonuclease Cas4
LSGKPDYVIRKDDRYIPVELKTGLYDAPQRNHVFQLAAYCHLLEENYNVFVPYGMLVYGNQVEYKIPFNPQVRFELENTIKKMRYLLKTSNITRNHDDPFRCKGCSMRDHCNIKLR